VNLARNTGVPSGFVSYGPIPKDDLIMILNSYFDGSNHADLSQCDRVVLATVCGNCKQWDGFVVEWNEVLARYNVPYLHVTQAVTLNRPYSVSKGWSDRLVDDFILDCVRITKRHAAMPSLVKGQFRDGLRAVTMSIYLEDYKRARETNPRLPNSVYELCTSEILWFVFRWGREVGAKWHHLYFDRGEAFRGHALDRARSDRVKETSPIFNDVVVKDEVNMRHTPALQLADLFAWCISHNDEPNKRLWHRALNDLPVDPSWESVYMDENYLANPTPGALERTAEWRLPRRGLRP
jgi:hypothetical protein